MLGIGKRNLCLICLCALLSGVLHMALYDVDFFDGFTQLYCAAFSLIWGISIQKRITDTRLRRFLLAIVFSLVLYVILQAAKYNLFPESIPMRRYLWYAFYLPFTMAPAFCYLTAVSVHRPPEERLPARVFLIPAACFLAGLIILTNDLHFLFRSFPDGVMIDNGSEKKGILSDPIYALVFLTYAAAIIIMLRKGRHIENRRLRWLPLVPLGMGIAYYLLYSLKIDSRLFGMRIWNIGEVLVFCLVGSLEACIQVGLIPANTVYGELFPLSGLSAVIRDTEGAVRFSSGPDPEPSSGNAWLQQMDHPIAGGSVEWTVDLSPLHELNQAIGDAAQQLEARNAYLADEAKVKEEKSALETRNRIYEHIMHAVQPQLDSIHELLEQKEPPFDSRLRQIVPRCTYIKRRSNMELLAEKDGTLPLEELSMAVLEMTETLKLCGVNAISVSGAHGDLPAPVVVDALLQIQRIIEAFMNVLSDLMIVLNTTADPEGLSVRVMLSTHDWYTMPEFAPWSDGGFSREVSVSGESTDLILQLAYGKGGGLP